MSNYPWLAEKKEQARMSKQQSVGTPSSPRAGLTENDFAFTGRGNPNDVAIVTRDGRTIHNGELMIGHGSGKVVTDATTSRELLSNPVISGRVADEKKGLSTGGYVDNAKKTVTNLKNIGRGTSTEGVSSPSTDVNLPSRDYSTNRSQQDLSLPNFSEGKDVSISNTTAMPERKETTTTTPITTGAQTTEAVPEKASSVIDADRLRLKGISAMENILETGVTSGTVAGQKQLSDLKSTQDVERQVMKQEAAQAGLSEDVAAGRLARLRGEHEGQLAETEAAIGIEQMGAQERAAQSLAQEGTIQANIDIARDVQGLNEKQFDEYVRQFDVGSDQWNKAFDENRKYNWAQFEESKFQFDVGSAQWEKAHQDQLDQWKASFDEQRRQFDTGSEQWLATFKEERRRYDADDDRWWASFDEQRHQFDVGSEQWLASFKEQGRQFDVGSEQWNKVHNLQVKEFQKGLELDKFSIEQWKDNVSYRDKAYLDTRSDAEARLEMERDVHEKNMDVVDLQIDAAKADEVSKRYWEGSERAFNYVSTHLDGYNEKTGELSWDAQNEMLKWAQTKYPGFQGSNYASADQYKAENPESYNSFLNWAKSEWKAAADGRLINPYDKMLYDVRTSEELGADAKNVIENVLTSPEALASIAGVEYNTDTGQIEIKTTLEEEGEQQVTYSTIKKKSKAVPDADKAEAVGPSNKSSARDRADYVPE